MPATIIDGKAFAGKVRAQVAEHVTQLKADHGITPGLAVVLVGEDPASQVYVRSKGKQTVEVGMTSVEHKPVSLISCSRQIPGEVMQEIVIKSTAL